MSNRMKNVAATAGRSSEIPLDSSRWSDGPLRRLAVDMKSNVVVMGQAGAEEIALSGVWIGTDVRKGSLAAVTTLWGAG